MLYNQWLLPQQSQKEGLTSHLYSQILITCRSPCRLLLSGWSSSGRVEEDGARRGESHHPGQSWAQRGGQPWPRPRPPAAGEEGTTGAQRESDRATHTSQWGAAEAPGRWEMPAAMMSANWTRDMKLDTRQTGREVKMCSGSSSSSSCYRANRSITFIHKLASTAH